MWTIVTFFWSKLLLLQSVLKCFQHSEHDNWDIVLYKEFLLPLLIVVNQWECIAQPYSYMPSVTSVCEIYCLLFCMRICFRTHNCYNKTPGHSSIKPHSWASFCTNAEGLLQPALLPENQKLSLLNLYLVFLQVPQNTHVRGLKKAIARHFEIYQQRIQRKVKISWKYIWKTYDLNFEGVILDKDDSSIDEYGVANKVTLSFKKKRKRK